MSPSIVKKPRQEKHAIRLGAARSVGVQGRQSQGHVVQASDDRREEIVPEQGQGEEGRGWRGGCRGGGREGGKAEAASPKKKSSVSKAKSGFPVEDTAPKPKPRKRIRKRPMLPAKGYKNIN